MYIILNAKITNSYSFNDRKDLVLRPYTTFEPRHYNYASVYAIIPLVISLNLSPKFPRDEKCAQLCNKCEYFYVLQVASSMQTC